MTYRLATMPTFEVAGQTHGGEPIRHNDGSLVIMNGEPGDDESRPALIVPRVAEVKRADRHDAEDPAQMALAQRVIDLLNLTPRDLVILEDAMTFAYCDDDAPIFDEPGGKAEVERVEAILARLKASV